MRLIQQSPGCSDFDVVLDGDDAPSFRILLPEGITIGGIEPVRGTHVIEGHWERTVNAISGGFTASEELRVGVAIEGRGREVAISLEVANRSSRRLAEVRADVCAAVNHLPGEPGWSNEAFLPSIPRERSLQGAYWYERVSPHNLQALTDRGWIGMHPCPDDARADGVPLYGFAVSESDEVHACAVASDDGSVLFFQAWEAPCRWVSPFPGNACMHLWPLVAPALGPGESSAVRGLCGMFAGGRDALAQRLDSFRGRPV